MAEGRDTIALADLVGSLRTYRYVILVTTAFCIAAGCLAAWVLPKKYEASTTLSPVSSQSGSGALGALGSSVSQLGGLASLAGISLGGGGAEKEAVATLQSEALTERYISENDLLKVLFKKYWDPVTSSWTTSDPEKMPTLWKGNQIFSKKVRAVGEIPKTGMVLLTVRWTDPEATARWANGLVKLTNDYLREKAIAEAERNIAYLNGEVGKTNVLELRSAMYSLIEQQIKKEMLARGSEEYALKVIDPAVVPEKPSSPGFVVWALVGLGAGLVLGTVLAVALGAMRPEN